MISISLQGLARYMAANHAGQRRILRRYKYPDRESRAASRYYQPALAAVSGRLVGRLTRANVLARAGRLEADAKAARDRRAAAKAHLTRVIRQYDEFVGDSVETLVPRRRGRARTHAGVRVKVTPDVATVHRRRELVKLWMSNDELSDVEQRVLVQGMFEGALSSGVRVPSSSIEVIDVARGDRSHGARGLANASGHRGSVGRDRRDLADDHAAGPARDSLDVVLAPPRPPLVARSRAAVHRSSATTSAPAASSPARSKFAAAASPVMPARYARHVPINVITTRKELEAVGVLGRPETLVLPFKTAINGSNVPNGADKDEIKQEPQRELRRDFSQMANATGGSVAFGVIEAKEPDGLKVAGGWDADCDPKAMKSRIEDAIAHAPARAGAQ